MSEAITTLQSIREATTGTEYEGRLFLVGGVLRDRALGLPVSDDVDLVTEEDAVACAEFLAARGLSDHAPVLFPRFGTAKICIAGHGVEIVTARAESYNSASRKPSVRQATLREDALRRDFTINTLMENLHTGEMLDLTARAQEDLRAGILRTPLEPHITFYDDPLRMMRAVRFACRFDFTIEPQAWQAICEEAGRLNLMGPQPPVVSAERIHDEFVKVMMSPACVAGLELLREANLLAQFAPELLEMVGVTQNAWHCYNVWDHTLKALEALLRAHPQAPLELRLGVLLHDVGKPRTRSEDARGVHFYEHQFVGAEMTRQLLTRLKFTNDEIRDVVTLVERHMRLGEARPDWSDAAMRRLIRALHPYTDTLFAISQADMEAMRQDVPHADLSAVRARMDDLNSRSNVALIDSPLDGNAIMEALGMPPGPQVRAAKEFLTNAVLDGRLAEGDQSAARALLGEWKKEQQNPNG